MPLEKSIALMYAIAFLIGSIALFNGSVARLAEQLLKWLKWLRPKAPIRTRKSKRQLMSPPDRYLLYWRAAVFKYPQNGTLRLDQHWTDQPRTTVNYGNSTFGL